MSTCTITFGDVAENGVRMEKLGSMAEHGFSKEDMLKILALYKEKGFECELLNIDALLGVEGGYASMLVVRGYNSGISAQFKEEHSKLVPDKKKKMHGRVCNSLARYNLCFSQEESKADYENGKGTVVAFRNVPVLENIRANIEREVGVPVQVAEGNYYYDITKCGIGWHGDGERKRVIGMRFGETMPFCIAWYQNSQRISSILRIDLNDGDMYILSEKAVGNDWLKKKVPTLRHSAGCDKYIQ